MGFIAKIKIGGRTSFGGNRREWGDQEFTVSGISNPVTIRRQGVLGSGTSYSLNKGVGITSMLYVYVQNVSATSYARPNGDIHIVDKTTRILRVSPGEAVQFTPYSSVQSMSIYLSAATCSAITFDYSIIGNK